jgi:hypothetical protein
MSGRSEHDRLAVHVPDALAELLGLRAHEVRVSAGGPGDADFLIAAAGQTFLVEFKTSSGAAPVAMAARQVQERARRIHGPAVPLLAVSFMGDVGKQMCEEVGVGWLDLSGNARIIAPGIRIIVDGQPNRFRSVGRPPNLFAPKSSRVVRWLLIHAGEAFTQRQLARATGITEGFVSRIVGRLEQEGYLVREEGAAVRPRDPALLLDAWRDAYQFSKHTLHAGHVAARSGDALLRFTADALLAEGIEHAATGLAAAWLLTRFAAFRIATVFLPADPSPALLERLGFRADPRGANLWLVVPNDAGVFHGAAEKDGIRCVHPVQAYLDLKGHPERAPEAAERLRGGLLNGSRDA